MRFPGESEKPCSCGCQPAASPTPPQHNGWISTTPSHTCHQPAADHPAKPACTGSGRSSATNTASKPTADGRYNNPNPASGSGDHQTATTTSSPIPEPTTSATGPSPAGSGERPRPRDSKPSPLNSHRWLSPGGDWSRRAGGTMLQRFVSSGGRRQGKSWTKTHRPQHRQNRCGGYSFP